jgi:hypothetical protein
MMEDHIGGTLLYFCTVFNVMSRKSISFERFQRLREEITVILSELEIYLPPVFLDVMVHLLVHIFPKIKDLGPRFLHNMMPFERMNGFIKGYVRNRTRPDGSIIKGFYTEECISFCTNYMDADKYIGLPINKHFGRHDGVGHLA